MQFKPQIFSTLYAYNYLVQKRVGNDVDRLGHTLYSSKIKLTPHQIQAALFAFNSPLSKGVILADEVGLGKTIEAGIILAQLWFERKRKILIVTPASLMKQWQNELLEKFGLHCFIMDRKTFKELQRKGYDNPFIAKDNLIICSYQTCSNYMDYIYNAELDYAIVDEAHKLRNVHNEKVVTANNIKKALKNVKKVLITATPIQNSLMDLFGLSTVIDENFFGDKGAFRYNYIKNYEENYDELIDRLHTVLHRTLRAQVEQYIKFTNRIPKTYSFTQTAQEKKVYEAVRSLLLNSDDVKYIIPQGQQHLLLLILCKLMGSSMYCIISTLSVIKERLIRLKNKQSNEEICLSDEMDLFEESEDTDNEVKEVDEIDIDSLDREICWLDKIIDDAKKVSVESKYIALQNALHYSFEHLRELGAEEKVIIFTESKRTQEYLYSQLCADGYSGMLVYNGTNTDEQSKQIYNEWISKPCNAGKTDGNKSVNMREAIISKFKDDGKILIATEAGAEGLNLQFCSLVINYDLPWNPQRVEQRIGRCHRFGQQYDVVVINFINEDNVVEKRIYDLLSSKFRLFDEVLGVSDSILGSIEEGGDIARSIIDIYTQCRSTEEINEAFDELQNRFKDEIDKAIEQTKAALLKNFDEDLQSYFTDIIDSANKSISEVEKLFWKLTKSVLYKNADFNDEQFKFTIYNNGKSLTYSLKEEADDIIAYNTHTELGEQVLDIAAQCGFRQGSIQFDISNYSFNISTIKKLKGKKGYLLMSKLTINSFETEERIILNGILDDGEVLDEDICEKLFRLSTKEEECKINENDIIQNLRKNTELLQKKFLFENTEKNNKYLQDQIKAINKWAEDKILGTQLSVELMREQRKELQRLADEADNIQVKEELEEKILRLSRKIKQSWLDLAVAEDDIEEQRKKMIAQLRKEAEKGHRVEDIMLVRIEVC